MSKKPPRRRALTPEQQSQKTRLRQQAVEIQHQDCEMEIRQRGPHWGLYCQEHNKWIRWMHPSELKILADQGVYL